jgi:hypothetical protein
MMTFAFIMFYRAGSLLPSTIIERYIELELGESIFKPYSYECLQKTRKIGRLGVVGNQTVQCESSNPYKVIFCSPFLNKSIINRSILNRVAWRVWRVWAREASYTRLYEGERAKMRIILVQTKKSSALPYNSSDFHKICYQSTRKWPKHHARIDRIN